MRRILWFLPFAALLFFVGCDKPGHEAEEIPTDGTSWEIINTSDNIMPNLLSGYISNGGEFLAVGASGGFVAVSHDGGEHWTTNAIPEMESEGYAVEGITFANEQVGVFGGKMSLYRTTNGGTTWVDVGEGVVGEDNIKAVQYIGDDIYYAISSGNFFVSNDGGATWTVSEIAHMADLKIGATGMDFYDADHGMLSTTGFFTFYTNDGGQNWYVEPLGMDTVFYDVAAVDTGIYYLCGQAGVIVYRSLAIDTTLCHYDTTIIIDSSMIIDTDTIPIDTTWEVDTTFDITFVDSFDTTVGIYNRANNDYNRELTSIDIYGSYGICVGKADADETVLISEDGGATWNKIPYANVYGDLLWTQFTPEGDAAILVGNDGVRGGGAIRICDGTFSNWNAANFGTTIAMQDMVFLDSQNGVFVGKKGAIYTTNDGGNTLIARVCPMAPDTGDITISGVAFISSTDGIAVGTDTLIIKTSDGGKSWQYLSGDNISAETDIDHLNKIQMVSENVGYIVGSGGIVLKTEDGGNTWVQKSVPDGIGCELLSLCFVSEDEGWVVGGSGVVLHTADGGDSWTQQETGVNSSLTGVKFVSSKLGWICGNMAILRTSDGGVNWEFTQVEPNLFGFFRDIDFSDSEHGWIVGNFGYILHTVDGGDTWYRQATGYTENNLYAIYILDNSHIWATGDNGIVMKLVP